MIHSWISRALRPPSLSLHKIELVAESAAGHADVGTDRRLFYHYRHRSADDGAVMEC